MAEKSNEITAIPKLLSRLDIAGTAITMDAKKPDWMRQEQYDSPETLVIRELCIKGKVLITTLLSPKEVSKTELKSLYKKCWQIEVDFRNIKTTMGIETLSCKTPELSEKEIWIYFLAYNLIRLLMDQPALLAD